MGNIGPGELLIIALIALLLFGAGRLADIGKGLGQGIKNFKAGLKEADAADDKKDEEAKKDDEKKPEKKAEKKEEEKKGDEAKKDDDSEEEEEEESDDEEEKKVRVKAKA